MRNRLAAIGAAGVVLATLAGCGSTVSSTGIASGAVSGDGLGATVAGPSDIASATGKGAATATTTTASGSTASDSLPNTTSDNTEASSPTGGATTPGTYSPVLKPVKIGFVVYDTAGFTAVTGSSDQGNTSSANQQADRDEMTALVAYANATGGVNGRKILPPIGYRLSTTDALNDQTLAAVCAKATEDDKVEAFIDRSFMITDNLVTCFARHHVNLASFLVATGDKVLRSVSPYVASTQPTVERSAKALIDGLATTDYFKGAKVGVVYDDSVSSTAAYNQIIVPQLKSHGVTVAEHFSVSSTDTGAQTNQGAAAVLRFRAAGITHVVWFAPFLAQLSFTNGAESQNYYPRYGWSDYAGGVGDAGFYVSANENKNSVAVSVLNAYVVEKSEVNKTRSVTSAVDRKTASPGARRCLDTLSKYLKTDYYRANAGRSTDYAFLCDDFFLWLEGARHAEQPFKAALWGAGVHALGRSYLAVLANTTDFTQRLSGADTVRIGIYANGKCKCFAAVGPWKHF